MNWAGGGLKGFMGYYTTGRRMYPGAYRVNDDTGRMEFFLKYFEIGGVTHKIFADRGEFESILQEVEKHYGKCPLYVRVLKRLIPQRVKDQIRITNDFN